MHTLLILVLIISQVAFAKPVLNIQNWTTKNGTKVLFTEAHELPMVDILVVFDAGSARDGKDFGLAAFTSAMLDSGTKALTADQVADKFEQIGAQFSAGTGYDTTLIDKDYASSILRKIAVYQKQTVTKKQIVFAMISANGLKPATINPAADTKQNPIFQTHRC